MAEAMGVAQKGAAVTAAAEAVEMVEEWTEGAMVEEGPGEGATEGEVKAVATAAD